MADYGEILEFLAANPPQFAAERELPASLLEMIAKCVRSVTLDDEVDEAALDCVLTRIRWGDFN